MKLFRYILLFLLFYIVAPSITSDIYGQYRDPFAEKKKKTKTKKKKSAKNKRKKALKKGEDPFKAKKKKDRNRKEKDSFAYKKKNKHYNKKYSKKKQGGKKSRSNKRGNIKYYILKKDLIKIKYQNYNLKNLRVKPPEYFVDKKNIS